MPVLLTPIIVPVILVGIGVFYAYVRLKLVNTLPGIVLAHSMLAMPLVMMVVTSALKSYDMNQEMVARSLGASRPQGVLAGDPAADPASPSITSAVLSFLTSFDEVVVAHVRLRRRQLDADAQRCSTRCATRSTRPSPRSRR